MRKCDVPAISASLLPIIFMFGWSGVEAQAPDRKNGIEIAAGAGMIIYQSVFATENFTGFELNASGVLNGPLRWQAGTRVWVDPVLPEIFGRIRLVEERGAWAPSAGIEIGATASPEFGEGSQLLRETRKALLKDAGPFYLSGYIAPLSFQIGDTWRMSAAEINVGTHFKNMGRTLRVYVNLFSLSRTF